MRIVHALSENLYFNISAVEQNFAPRLPCSSTELVKESIRVKGKDVMKANYVSTPMSGKRTLLIQRIQSCIKNYYKIYWPGIARAEKKVLRQYDTFTVKTIVSWPDFEAP